jgi:hypothetical protein
MAEIDILKSVSQIPRQREIVNVQGSHNQQTKQNQNNQRQLQ